MEKRFEERVIVSSFDHKFLTRMHQLYPAIRTGALSMPVRDIRKKPSAIRRRTGAVAFICDRLSLRQKHVADAHSHRMLVASYVINSSEHLHDAVDLGVDVIVTDYPGRMITALEKLGFNVPHRKNPIGGRAR